MSDAHGLCIVDERSGGLIADFERAALLLYRQDQQLEDHAASDLREAIDEIVEAHNKQVRSG